MMETPESSGWRGLVRRCLLRRRDKIAEMIDTEELSALEASLTAEGERRRGTVNTDGDRVDRIVAGLRRQLREGDEAQ